MEVRDVADADAMADVHAMADMDAAAETRAADVAHAADVTAAETAAAMHAATEAAGIGRVGGRNKGAKAERGDCGQRQHGVTDLLEHLSLLGVSSHRCFGHWSLGPARSVHGSVRFLPFNSRNLAFIARSSGDFGGKQRHRRRAPEMLPRNHGARRA
jgi:hypothetical protein